MTTPMTNALNSIDKYIDLLETKIRVLSDLADIHRKTIKRQADTISSLKQQLKYSRAKDYEKDIQHWQAQAEREHNAFVQAAEERDQAIRDKMDLRKRLTSYSRKNKKLTETNESLQATFEAQLTAANIAKGQKDQAIKNLEKALTKQASLEHDVELMGAFIDNICEMVACDAELSDIAYECIAWRRGEWAPTNSDSENAPKVGDEVKEEDQCHGDPYDAYKWKVLVVEHKGDDAVFTGFYSNYGLACKSVDLMVARGCYEAWVEELL